MDKFPVKNSIGAITAENVMEARSQVKIERIDEDIAIDVKMMNMKDEAALAEFEAMDLGLEPVNGVVQPPVYPPEDKPHRNTNALEFVLKAVFKPISKHKFAPHFRTPVDAIKLKLSNYHNIIKNPMDLTTIRKRIENCFYYNVKECIQDFQLLFYNCYRYNEPGEDIVMMAKKIENIFVTKMKNCPKEEIELPIPNKSFRGKRKRKKGKGAGRPKIMAGSSTRPNSKLTSDVPIIAKNYVAAPAVNSQPALTGTTDPHSVPGSTSLSLALSAAPSTASTLQHSSYSSSSTNDSHLFSHVRSCSVSFMPPPPQCPPVVTQIDCRLAECPPHAESSPVFTDQTEVAIATNPKHANSEETAIVEDDDITIIKVMKGPSTRIGTRSSRRQNSLGGNPDKKRGRSVGSKNKMKPTSVCDKKKRGQKVSKEKKIELSKAPATPFKLNKKVKIFNGPYVHIVGNKDHPSSIEIINVALKKEKMIKVQTRRNFNETAIRIKKEPVDRLSTHFRGAFNRDKIEFCIFCHKGSHTDALGDLFGPYFIKNKNPESTKSSAVRLDTSSSSTRGKRHYLDTSEDSKGSKRAKHSASYESTPRGSTTHNDPDTADMHEFWVHEDCAIWCPNISLVGGEVRGLEEAVVEAKENTCCRCSLHGATLSCYGRSCKQLYHFSCAKETGCLMDIEKFMILCPTHHTSNFYTDNQARSCGM